MPPKGLCLEAYVATVGSATATFLRAAALLSAAFLRAAATLSGITGA